MESDVLGIERIDYLEIICGNAKQAAYFYANVFGFKPIAYRGPESGSRELCSYVLESHNVTLVLTTPLSSDHYLSEFHRRHGDAVKDVSFRVDDCREFIAAAEKRGATVVTAPKVISDSAGEVVVGSVATYGDVVHSAVERKNYRGIFAPGYISLQEFLPELTSQRSVGVVAVDHVVGNVELGKMEHWVKWYGDVLGFSELKHFTAEDISTEYSALMSKVVKNGSGKIKLPINEPAEGRRKSQIQEYLEFNNGPGVQHIALLTGDIVSTVRELRERGMSFLRVPQTYYEELPTRIGEISESVKELAELGILADRDEDGYLLQVFTKPVQDRPTLFFEIIQRRGSQGFGVGNFKALFEAIEREQERRGNL